MVETWKDINGYKGYQVSNLGRVRSLDKPIKNKVATFIKKGKILTCALGAHVNNTKVVIFLL